MTRLLLASQSPARLKTLRSAGIEPIVQPSEVDEDEVIADATQRQGELTASETALILARAKAEEVSRSAPDDVLILGCDSVLDIDSITYGKPVNAAEAVRCWRIMRGREGTLYTGHWLIHQRSGTGRATGASAATTVRFADITDAEIADYVATGEPLNVAGAFTVDGLGGPFVTGVDGDFHNVVGLSLPLLRDLLAEFGLSVTQLWRWSAIMKD